MATTYALFAQTVVATAPARTSGTGSTLRRVQFFKRDFAGGAITIPEADEHEPFVIKLPNKDDSRFVGVWPEELLIGLLLRADTDVRLFYVSDPFQVQVRVDEVSADGTLIAPVWSGYLSSGDLKQPLTPGPYGISLSAVCGLSLLAKQPALTLTGHYPDANLTLREVIEGCLAQTGLGLPVQSILNLSPSTDRSLTSVLLNRDPLTSLWVQPDSFRKDNNPLSARAVLQAICEDFSANLYQYNNTWLLVAANEPHGGWVGHLGGYTITDRQCWIRGKTDQGFPTGGLLDVHAEVNAYRPEQLRTASRLTSDAPTVSLQATASAVAVSQTFGAPVSRLKNGAFGNLDPAGFPVFWQKSDPTHPVFRIGDGSPATPFAIRITGSGTDAIPLNGGTSGNLLAYNRIIGFRQSVFFNPPTTAPLTLQEQRDLLAGKGAPARYIPESAQPMRLRGRFRGAWIRGAKIWIVCRFIKPDAIKDTPFPDTAMLMDGAATWQVNPSRKDLYALDLTHYTTLPATPTQAARNVTTAGYCEIDVAIPKAPFPLIEMRFEFCQGNELEIPAQGGHRQAVPDNETPYIDYEGLVLTVGDEEKRLTGQTFTVQNFPNVAANLLEQPVESVVTLTLGDVPTAVPPTANGYLIYDQTFQPAGRFNRPRLVAGSTDKPLALWSALQRAAQVAHPAQLVETTLLGHLPHGPLSILHFLDQPGYEGASSYYQLVGWEWNVHEETHKITGLELLREVTPYRVTGEWDTPNGRIPFALEAGEDADAGSLVISEPLPPTIKNRRAGSPKPKSLMPSKRERR